MIVKTIQEMNDEMWSKYHGLHESFINYAPEMMHKAIEIATNCHNQTVQRAALKLLNFSPIHLTEDKYGPYCYCEYIMAAKMIMTSADVNNKYNNVVHKAMKIMNSEEIEAIRLYLFE